MFMQHYNEEEYKCVKCERYFIDEDIYQYFPCICKVCSKENR